LFAPAAALTWDLDSSALPYIAGAAVFQVPYISLLTRSYERADLSFVYPEARGSAPVIVLLVGTAVLASEPSAVEVAGILAVVLGIALVSGLRRPEDPGALLLALGTGCAIAGYTLIDSKGVDHAAPLSYLEVEMALTGGVWLAWLGATRGAPELRRALVPRSVLMGMGMFGAYVLVLAALQRADPAPVSAVRETSIVMAAILGALMLKERPTAQRVAGALVVTAGVAAIALG
jgi:drug/metabolite transporter (DMT)-like permease